MLRGEHARMRVELSSQMRDHFSQISVDVGVPCRAKLPNEPIKITLPDGTVKEGVKVSHSLQCSPYLCAGREIL